LFCCEIDHNDIKVLIETMAEQELPNDSPTLNATCLNSTGDSVQGSGGRKPRNKKTIKSNPTTPVTKGAHNVLGSISTEERLRRKLEVRVRLDQVAGLDPQIEQLKECIVNPIEQSIHFDTLGRRPPHSVLLHGLPGTGKTLLLNAFEGEYGSKLKFVRVECRSILAKGPSDPEQQLQALLDEAKEAAPRSVLIMDDLDLLFPARKSPTDQERRLLTLLLEFLDSLTDRRRVFVLAAARKPEDVEPRLRRARRFERELELSAPLAAERRQILKLLLSDCNHSLKEDQIARLGEQTIAYTGADLACMLSTASLSASRARRNRFLYEDVDWARNQVRPSAMRNVQLEVPTVRWTDIGGQHDLKQRLIAALVWPVKYAHVYRRFNERQPKGILLYGPPGCSKTMIGKALATECDHRFLSVKGPEIFSKYVGESERTVRDIFEKARQVSPAIIFIDEIDALAIERGRSDGGSSAVNDKVVSTLLNELDGVEQLKDVFVVATTNRPDVIDSGLLRPGRLDSIIYVPLPDFETRREVFRIRMGQLPPATCTSSYSCLKATIAHLSKQRIDTENLHLEKLIDPCDTNHDPPEAAKACYEHALSCSQSRLGILDGEHFEDQLTRRLLKVSLNSKEEEQQSKARFEFVLNMLAKLTDGYSGAELSTVCHEAFVLALQHSVTSGYELEHIHFDFYLQALLLVKPRTDAAMVEQYEQFALRFAANYAAH
jgi:SpoVK/Ycf46/Vps4 family AAA+-type ATPase